MSNIENESYDIYTDIAYFNNMMINRNNSHFNMLRILPTNNIENEILNNSLYDKSKYKKVISKKDEEKYLNKSKFDSKKNLNNSCPIFQINFNDGDEIIELPCKHCYDPTAIKKWLKEENNECPVCRYEFDFDEKINEEHIINNTDEISNISENLAQSLNRSYSLPQNNATWNTQPSIIRPHNISLIQIIMNELIERENERDFQEALLNSLDE